MTEVSDTLRAARKLIEKPENWCRGPYAGPDMKGCRTCAEPLNGRICAPRAVDAVAAPGSSVHKAAMAVLDAECRPYDGLRDMNDCPVLPHCAIRNLFDRAIEMEEADG